LRHHVVGITPSALSKIESGVNVPHGFVLLRIARELGVPFEYLLDESPYPHVPPVVEVPEKPRAEQVMKLTMEEEKLVWVLRDGSKIQREVLTALPGLSQELLALVHFVVLRGVDRAVRRAVRRSLHGLSGRRG
jgi:transcriptional regulator with XRE-family HTH domain